MNNLHPSIKFTYEKYNTTISFLDTSSSLSEGVLSTDVYSKPTDTNQYLLPSSCHPPHVTKGIPYSQALRIRRICSTDKSLKKRLGQLKNDLKRRGYKQSIIKKSFNKYHSISRNSLLQYKEKQICKRTPCVLTYHSFLRNSFMNGVFVSIGHPSKKIPSCPKSFLSLPWLPSNNQTV